ncbi:acyl--CoA ligase [bacterium]|nr:acyl--CoA ligase [bacterium]
MIGKSILQQITDNSLNHPSKVALVSNDAEVTYAQLVAFIGSAGQFLKSKGVVKGDRIVISATKELEFVYVYFALHLIGAVCVIVDAESNAKWLNYIIDKTKPRYIIGHFNEDYQYPKLSYSDISLTNLMDDFSEALFDIQLSDVCDMPFTTGTTGNPKGVLLTQGNIACTAVNINQFVGNTEDDVEILALPVSHSFGMGRLRCALSTGSTLVMLGSFANLKVFFNSIEKYHATGFGMVPSIWNYIRKITGKRIAKYASQIKYIEIGSAPMTMENKHLLRELFPFTRICMHYGLTEASRSAFIEFHKDFDHLDSIGKASPNVQIRIMNDNGEDVNPAEEGEICVHGGMVMLAYADQSDNDKSFYENYFRTGDWGFADSEGYIQLVGRQKELINVGGENVSPVEVEDFLNNIAGVADSACVAIADPGGILGEVVKAYIVQSKGAKLDFRGISNQLRSILEPYKVPVKYELIDSIPTTASGKKQRIDLRSRNNG